MKKSYLLILGVVLVSALLVSCSSGSEAAPVVEEVSSEGAAEENPALEEVEEPAALLLGEVEYTWSQLEAMEMLEVEYTGKDDSITVFSGVLVLDLISEAGLSGETVVFTASDGYEAELALAELEGCADCVVAIDGDELRLVLPDFPGSLQVKGLVKINLK